MNGNFRFNLKSGNSNIISDGWHEFTIDVNNAWIIKGVNGVRQRLPSPPQLDLYNNKPAADMYGFDVHYLRFDIGGDNYLCIPYSFKYTIPNNTDPRRTVYIS